MPAKKDPCRVQRENIILLVLLRDQSDRKPSRSKSTSTNERKWFRAPPPRTWHLTPNTCHSAYVSQPTVCENVILLLLVLLRDQSAESRAGARVRARMKCRFRPQPPRTLYLTPGTSHLTPVIHGTVKVKPISCSFGRTCRPGSCFNTRGTEIAPTAYSRLVSGTSA